MNKPEISIVMPAIRRERWNNVYNSIAASTKRSWELIIVSPFPLTNELNGIGNVKYIKDFGSPTRCSNIGALVAEGKLITWTSDDGLFLENMLDIYIDSLYNMLENEKNVITGKYLEGVNYSSKNEQSDKYYTIGNCEATALSKINPDFY